MNDPRKIYDLILLANGITKELGEERALPEANRPYPDRYLYLAVQAFEQGAISQGQLARFLRCDPVSARELVSECLTNLHVEDDGQQ